MNFLTDNKRMIQADQAGVLEGSNPPEKTTNWTSQKYIEKAQRVFISHLMNELKKYKEAELKAIDHEQKVLTNLTLDQWNK